jgi:hypothetical protein
MTINPHTPILMIDTETTNDIDCPIVYDVGYQIFTLADGILCEKSYVNSDVFLDEKMMENAFFADKIPQYKEEIRAEKRQLAEWWYIKQRIKHDCLAYGVEIACAHNASFDNRALNTTQRYITTSKYRYFLPFGIEWWDTLKMARSILKNNEDYGQFCYENDYLTKNGQRRYTAEVIYKWLTNNLDFSESHTGLEDVKIEKEIFTFCISENPEINGKLWKD